MDVLVLIDKLDDLVHNAKSIMMTDQVRVDKEEIYDILDQMRATIPEEIKQARWIVKERQEMLAEAKREAERILKEARDEQMRLISEEEVVKQAERQAEEIVDEARTREREIRLGAEDYAVRLRYTVELSGPCMRCLEDAARGFEIDVREVHQPAGGEDLESPYIDGDELELRAWARDSLALDLPAQIVCREDCRGICPICGENLNTAGPEHRHEQAPDPRWAKLSELRLD